MTCTKDKFEKALDAYHVKIAARAAKGDVETARKAVTDALAEFAASDEANKNLKVADAAVLLGKADEMMKLAGYESARPAPTGVPGNDTGTPNGPGSIPDVQNNGKMPEMKPEPTDKPISEGDGISAEERETLRLLLSERKQALSDAERKEGIQTAIKENESLLAGLPDAIQTEIKNRVSADAPTAATVPALLKLFADAQSKIEAARRLAGQGLEGKTVDPLTGNHVQVREGLPAYMSQVEKILAACDETAARTGVHFDPKSGSQKKLRDFNRKEFIDTVLKEDAARRQGARNATEYNAMCDDADAAERGLVTALQAAEARADSTTLANVYNQPAIATALLIQAFQDMEALQFVEGYGPGLSQNGSAGWLPTGAGHEPGKVGSVLRIPIEYVVDPSGYGTFAGPQFDAGLLVPEGVGIPEMQVLTTWQAFAPSWRRIAASATHDVIKAMGNGPLNYDVIGRHLFHIAYKKQRVIDKALLDEMLQTSSEYGAIPLSANETVSLPNNSVYNASGKVAVNLNTSKTASATVAAGDSAVVYGANVVAAIRLQTAGSGTAAPYCGTSAGVVPLVQPRVVADLSAVGQITTSVRNPIAFAAPATGMVQGYFDANGNIQTFPAPAGSNPPVANFAVDYENGVIAFTAGVPSLAGSGGVVTAPALSLSAYSYETNYDIFSLTVPNGVEPSLYYNRLLAQFDASAAKMGSSPRYNPPNLAIMSLVAATYIQQAQIFYKLNSPNGTELYPTDSYFFERNGVRGARINAPWRAGDRRILLGKKGATKYGVDTPFEIRGPYPAYDQTGAIIGKDIYYGEENSATFTPQVIDQNGNNLNPPYRTLALR